MQYDFDHICLLDLVSNIANILNKAKVNAPLKVHVFTNTNIPMGEKLTFLCLQIVVASKIAMEIPKWNILNFWYSFILALVHISNPNIIFFQRTLIFDVDSIRQILSEGILNFEDLIFSDE